MACYDVTITREDDLWVAVVHGLPEHVVGAFDGERLAELVDDAAEVVAGLTDTDAGQIELRWRFEVNGRDVTDSLGRLLALEHDLRPRLAERDEVRARVIRELTEAGLSRRATGDAVGLSGARIQQLVG